MSDNPGTVKFYRFHGHLSGRETDVVIPFHSLSLNRSTIENNCSIMELKAKQVQTNLSRQGLRPQNFACPTPTSATAAAAVGCSVGEIAKSILMLVGGQPVIVITSGDTRVKSGRLKQATGLTGKVTLPGTEEVKKYTGYAPGAVCPFLLPEQLPVLLDQSLQRFALIYPAAATQSSAVALTVSRLAELCGGRLVDVCDIEDLTDTRKE